jgi:tyrosyl-tRNA synthetase
MFQERLKDNLPIHTHEILYPLLQGYDSVEMDVDLEIGGTDQTFNMMMGRTLQKAYHNKEKWVLTTPIINGFDGRKMSKSYNNYVALTENPNDMYGKLMKISDDIIVDYFTLLTDTPLDEIENMAKNLKDHDVNPMDFKKKLAMIITSFYHSREEAIKAESNFQKVVQDKGIPDVITECIINNGHQNQIQVLDLLMQCNLPYSKSEAKRLVEQGGVAIADNIISDWHSEIRIADGTIVRAGKRNFIKVKLQKE